MPSYQPPGPIQPPSDEELVLKVIPMPADTNGNGDIFGGWVMAQVDLAGAVLPARYVRGRMATVAVNEFIFKHHGYKALYQLGKEIDKAYAPENNGRAYGFAESIEIDYEHRK